MSVAVKRSIFSVIPVMVLIVILIVLFSSFSISAGQSSEERTKKFASLTVEDGDTLWSIATEYKTKEYSNIDDYINELKSINNLNDDLIKEGELIVVPYYSDEK